MTTNNSDDTETRELSHADLVKMLGMYVDCKKERKGADDLLKTLAKPLREYLERHPTEQIYDGERRVKAFLQTKKGTPELDCMSLAEKDAALAIWALSHGLLKLDKKAWEGLAGKAQEMAQLENFVSPGAGSEALQVVEEK
jgi:hypothetical protein